MTRPLSLLAVTVALLWTATSARTQSVIGSLPFEVVAPADNPTTPEKVELGRLLFWDPVLSGAKDVACATCHHPDFGYTDSLDLSMGTHGLGLGATRRFDAPGTRPFVKRNSPTLLNIGFSGIDMSFEYEPSKAPMFWDMRVRSLEAQALEPLKAVEEMRGDTFAEPEAVDMVVARLQAIPEYRARFTRAFNASSAVTAANLGKAIAAFERSLTASNSPFDRYVRGDSSAMTPLQLSGMQRFQTRRLRELPQGTDVHRLPGPHARCAGQSGVARIGRRRGRPLPVPHGVASQPEIHRAVHAQRHAGDARRRVVVLQRRAGLPTGNAQPNVARTTSTRSYSAFSSVATAATSSRSSKRSATTLRPDGS